MKTNFFQQIAGLVLLHTLFIISMIAEYAYKGSNFNCIILLVFLLLIMLKVWVISSLGKYWNTKILRIPNSAFIKKRPYYIKRPKRM